MPFVTCIFLSDNVIDNGRMRATTIKRKLISDQKHRREEKGPQLGAHPGQRDLCKSARRRVITPGHTIIGNKARPVNTLRFNKRRGTGLQYITGALLIIYGHDKRTAVRGGGEKLVFYTRSEGRFAQRLHYFYRCLSFGTPMLLLVNLHVVRPLGTAMFNLFAVQRRAERESTNRH